MTIAAALVIATNLFGPAPCGTPTVVYESALPETMIGYNDRATCRILLAPWLRYEERDLRCHTIVHEYGHLTGHTHSHKPRNVMFPTPRHIYWRCR